MSVVNEAGEKLVLSQNREDWRLRYKEFAGDDLMRWRALACLSLQLHGWTSRMIGAAVGLDQSRVVRIIAEVRGELTARFGALESPPRDLAGAASAEVRPQVLSRTRIVDFPGQGKSTDRR